MWVCAWVLKVLQWIFNMRICSVISRVIMWIRFPQTAFPTSITGKRIWDPVNRCFSIPSSATVMIEACCPSPSALASDIICIRFFSKQPILSYFCIHVELSVDLILQMVCWPLQLWLAQCTVLFTFYRFLLVSSGIPFMNINTDFSSRAHHLINIQ